LGLTFVNTKEPIYTLQSTIEPAKLMSERGIITAIIKKHQDAIE
jgi:hypothetical protein